MFKALLKVLSEGKTLTKQEAKGAMDAMMQGNVAEAQVAGLLSMMRLRGETIAEMTGFALSMREHALALDHSEPKLLDTCGTGGDDLSTFNISTTTAIVVSACDVKIAKHGNRAISSNSGSADVLEALKIPVQASPAEAIRALKDNGLCFLFAPLYHQSMKHVAATRKLLGFKTIFNLLGPLVNPAKANRQMIGVFDTNFAEKMAETLRELGTERAVFVTGGDGIDECSITTFTDVVELNGSQIKRYQLTPEEVGLERGKLIDIQATSVQESATIIENILLGKANKTAENIVVLNSAMALYVADEVETVREGVEKIQMVLRTGKAYQQFQKLQDKKEEIQANVK